MASQIKRLLMNSRSSRNREFSPINRELIRLTGNTSQPLLTKFKNHDDVGNLPEQSAFSEARLPVLAPGLIRALD
jgi:hypothetical protein